MGDAYVSNPCASNTPWGTLTIVPHDLVCLRLDLLVLGQVPSGPLQVFFLHRGTLLLDRGFRSANLGKPRTLQIQRLDMKTPSNFGRGSSFPGY